MKTTNKLKFIETECSCLVCKSMCLRPCWPTPEEAELLIELGYGDRLMKDWLKDWWVADEGNIYVLCPAQRGYEKRQASSWLHPVPCTFQTADGLCELHDKKLKPVEGRAACCTDGVNLHEAIAKLWDNKKAQALVKKWEVDNEKL